MRCSLAHPTNSYWLGSGLLSQLAVTVTLSSSVTEDVEVKAELLLLSSLPAHISSPARILPYLPEGGGKSRSTSLCHPHRPSASFPSLTHLLWPSTGRHSENGVSPMGWKVRLTGGKEDPLRTCCTQPKGRLRRGGHDKARLPFGPCSGLPPARPPLHLGFCIQPMTKGHAISWPARLADGQAGDPQGRNFPFPSGRPRGSQSWARKAGRGGWQMDDAGGIASCSLVTLSTARQCRGAVKNQGKGRDASWQAAKWQWLSPGSLSPLPPTVGER